MTKRYLQAWKPAVVAVILLLGLVMPCQAQQDVVIGVLAEDDIDREQPRWDALAAYLMQAEPDWKVTIQVMSLDEIDAANKYHQLHFVLTDPAHFTRLQRRATYTKAIATLVRRIGDEPVPALAGTIVVSASRRDLDSIASLKGLRIAMHGKGLLGGFQAQLDALHRQGVETNARNRFIQTGGEAAAPLSALQEGRADAAFVRAGTLEELAFRSELALNDYRVVDPQQLPGFPFAVSTRLFPDWPMVALVPASPEQVRKLGAHLLAINPTSRIAEKLGIYGFEVPANYLVVAELARKLRLPPFDVAPHVTLADIWSEYRAWLVSLVVASIVIVLMLVGMLLQKRSVSSAQASAVQNARARERSESMLRNTLEQAPYVAVQWFDQQGRVRYWNKASEDLYGWSSEQAQGKQTDELFQSPVQAREFRALIDALVDGEHPSKVREQTYITKAREPVTVLSTVFVSRDGEDETYVKMDVDITSRRKAEHALNEERALSRAVFQALPDVVWLKDMAGVYLQCNERLGQFLGHAPADIVGKTDYDFLDRNQADVFVASDKEVVARGRRVYEREYTFASDGHRETVEVTKTPLMDDDGKLLGVIGVAHDVTAARAARAALVDSQERYRALVETTQDWIWEVDAEGCFTYSSPTVWDLLEYSATHMVGVPQYKLVAESDRDRIRELFGAPSEAPRPFKHVEAAFQHRNGSRVIMELSAVPIIDEAGEFKGYRGITRDVSLRKGDEDALRKSQERFDLAMQASNDGLWDWDLAADSVYFSPRWKQMLGYQEHELRNEMGSWERLVNEEGYRQTQLLIDECRAGKREGFLIEYRMSHKTDGWRDILCRGIVVRDDEGRLTRLVGTHSDITERTQAEHELSEAQRMAHVGHWRFDHRQLQLHWSDELFRIFESVPHAFSEDRDAYLQHVHAEDRQLVEEAYRQHYNDRTPLKVEHRLVMPNGRIKHIAQLCETEFDAQGRALSSLGIIRDVSREKELADKLHSSEYQANLIIERAQDGMVVTDSHGTIVRVNPMATSIFGYTADELLGKPVEVLLPASKKESHQKSFRSYMENPVPCSVQGNRAGLVLYGERSNGERFPLEVNLSPVMIDDEQHVVASMRDVSLRISSENALRESESKLRDERDFMDAVLDAAASIVVVMGHGGQIVRFNKAAEEITGYRFEELQGQPLWTRLIVPEERTQVRNHFAHLEKDDITGNFEAEWLMKDGSRRLFDWRNSVLTDMTGAVTYVISQGYDITDKRAAEEALRSYQEHLEDLVSERTADLEAARVEAERLLKVKSDFLANMSHEIRTPLNAVLGLAQLGAKDTQGIPDKARVNYQRILDSGQHLLGLINDILDFSKADVGKLILESTPFALSECIDRAVNFIAARAHAQGLNLVVLEDASLPDSITGDITRLTQIMTNLLSNAVKFTKKGAIGFSICREDRELVFRVTDTGIGMTGDQQAVLFQPFEQGNTSTTREYGGTGLGMAISKRLVDEMKGQIFVNSWADIGTTVEVRIPLSEAEAKGRDEHQGCPSIRVAGFDPKSQEDLVTVLQASGYRVDATDLAGAYADLDGQTALLVGEQAFADRTFTNAVREHGNHPLPVQVLRNPVPRQALPEDLEGRVSLLDWPLRARHLCREHQAEKQPAQVAKVRCGRLAGLTFLAAEDNDINRIVLEDLLHKEKAKVRFAENGQMLLDLIEKEGIDGFDLVLMDIQMPVMDGHTATRKLLARHPDMPVIGLTAHALAEERERCLASGMVEHVTKPIDVDTLVGAILRHVDARPQPTAEGAAAAVPAPAAAGRTADSAQVDSSSLIDWQALNDRFDNRTAFINKVLQAIYDSHSASPENLRQHVVERDFEKLAFLAHSLKGTAGNMMARSLFELAKRTETLARAEDEEAWAAAGELSALLDKVMMLLGEHLEQA